MCSDCHVAAVRCTFRKSSSHLLCEVIAKVKPWSPSQSLLELDGKEKKAKSEYEEMVKQLQVQYR